jgi:hypothetical protein
VLCEEQNVLFKSVIAKTVKRENIVIYSHSYSRYIGKHMAITELQVGCMPSYK